MRTRSTVEDLVTRLGVEVCRRVSTIGIARHFQFPLDLHKLRTACCLDTPRAASKLRTTVPGTTRFRKNTGPQLAGAGSRAKGDQERTETRAQVLPKGRAGETSG